MALQGDAPLWPQLNELCKKSPWCAPRRLQEEQEANAKLRVLVNNLQQQVEQLQQENEELRRQLQQ